MGVFLVRSFVPIHLCMEPRGRVPLFDYPKVDLNPGVDSAQSFGNVWGRKTMFLSRAPRKRQSWNLRGCEKGEGLSQAQDNPRISP